MRVELEEKAAEPAGLCHAWAGLCRPCCRPLLLQAQICELPPSRTDFYGHQLWHT